MAQVKNTKQLKRNIVGQYNKATWPTSAHMGSDGVVNNPRNLPDNEKLRMVSRPWAYVLQAPVIVQIMHSFPVLFR